jgi:beta-N-acetylhexosaminidase
MSAGPLVMVDVRGTALDDAQRALLRDHAIRAVVLFRHNLGDEAEVRALTADLRATLGPRALIGIDQEGGAVVRATFLPQPPPAMALGAAHDEALAEAVGAAVARGLRSLGINWNFAPVLDVNSDPANPVIGERSFGDDPATVTRLAGAWMRGALREGVACCVKHFPGHGDTHVDSHLDLPVVDKPRSALDAVELAPFRALRDVAPAMMTAHIVYPQIDAGYPATLSRAILGDILRHEWGYEGVVITDSLVMSAVQDRFGHERASVLALQAGADMVMALGEPEQQRAALHAIDAAISHGALAPRQVERALARLDALARRYPAQPRPYDADTRRSDDALMRRAWARALTALRSARPPARDAALRVITQRAVPGDGVSEPGVPGARVASLFDSFPRAEVVQVDDLARFDPRDLPRDGALRVLASNVRARYGASRPRWTPDLHLVLWNPFHALDFAAPSVVTWGFADGALDALKEWLEDRADAPGRAPVALDQNAESSATKS